MSAGHINIGANINVWYLCRDVLICKPIKALGKRQVAHIQAILLISIISLSHNVDLISIQPSFISH